MRFKGQLLLPNERGPGLQVHLDVAAHHLAVESEDGGLGAWPLEVVDVRRLQGDVFAMTVAGEDLNFVADDALSFAYSGLPAIKNVSKVKTRSGFRGWLSGIWSEEPKKPISLPQPSIEPIAEKASAPAWSEGSGETRTADLTLETPEPLEEQVVDVTSDALGSKETEDPFAVEDWLSGDGIGERRETRSCRGRRSDGRPCESPVVTSSGYCVAHDPRRAVTDGYRAAHEARARLKAQSTARLNRVYSKLEKAMRQVERGEIDPEIAMAMAQLAQTMCAILDLDDQPGQDRPRSF